jgi:hypothetical protein
VRARRGGHAKGLRIGRGVAAPSAALPQNLSDGWLQSSAADWPRVVLPQAHPDTAAAERVPRAVPKKAFNATAKWYVSRE